MNFTLTKEQLLLRQMLREFSLNEVKPLAAEVDEEERFPLFFSAAEEILFSHSCFLNS